MAATIHISKSEARKIEASLYDQKLSVHLGHLTPAEYVERCDAAIALGIELRSNVVAFADKCRNA